MSDRSGRKGWMDATDSQPHEAFFYVELLCNIWFIVEFTTRFLVITVYVKIGFSMYLLNDANKVHSTAQHMTNHVICFERYLQNDPINVISFTERTFR